MIARHRPLRILVVDDDPAMVGAITALVGTEGHQVITAYDGLTAVKRFREERPTSSCSTWRCPDPTGSPSPARCGPPGRRRSSSCRARAPRRRRSGRSASAPTTTSSSRSARPSCWPGSRRSCAGWIGRPAAPTTGPVSAGSLVLEPARHEARVGETALTLTPTEFRLLEALVRAAGDIVPHHLLARAGWPAETDPDLLWLKPHLARLRAKVEGAGGPQILAVRGVGYRIEAERLDVRPTACVRWAATPAVRRRRGRLRA